MAMENVGVTARRINPSGLDDAFVEAHERTWAILRDLAPPQWQVPYDPGINPPLWEYGHVAWFTEHWVLRDAHAGEGGAFVPRRSSLLPDADRWFDSMRVAHPDRWHLDLPALAEIRGYADAVLAGVRARLAAVEDSDEALYFFRLALLHEDMHAEALTYMRQRLDYPPATPLPTSLSAPCVAGDAGEVPSRGGRFTMGSPRDGGFVFDNEKWAHEVQVAPVRIDRQCVSNGAFAEFVAAGGYRDERWWSNEGKAWLEQSELTAPMRWRIASGKHGEGWQQRWFGQWQPLALDAPVCHINAYEAEAFCRWAGRRLPTEAEWECAASQGLIDWGSAVWEWTADPFELYPGFAPDPYREYSLPWFHTHRAVRGGSFATHPRIRHPRYRNFYLPERGDIFVGFRTCRD